VFERLLSLESLLYLHCWKL